MRLSFRSIFPPPLFTERSAKLRPRGPPSRQSSLRKWPLGTSELRKLRWWPTRGFCLTCPRPEGPTWVVGRSRSIGRSGGGHAHSEGSGLGSSVICGFDWRSGEMVVWAGLGRAGLAWVGSGREPIPVIHLPPGSVSGEQPRNAHYTA